MIKDRRKGIERRSQKRYETKTEIDWEGIVGRQKGIMSDISPVGCFILCSGEVENGETIKLFVPVSDGMKIQFQGEVVNHVFEIGFGLKFVNLNEAQKELLQRIIDTVRES